MTTKDPYKKLRDAYYLLLSNNEYRSRYYRIGGNAMEKSWDDPCNKPDPLDVLCNFRMALAADVIPGIRTLAYVANCFAKYLEGEGNGKNGEYLTLDEAFNLAHKYRAGHPLAQKKRKDKDDEFLFHMAVYRGKNPDVTINQAATAVAKALDPSSLDCEDCAERMTRYYHSEGWAKIEKLIDGGKIRFEPYHPPERK